MDRKELEAELDKLIAEFGLEVLKTRLFRDYGCINFRSDEFYHELALARILHSRMIESEPDKHSLSETEPMRCYHVTTCTCGYKEACDSSD